FVYLLFTQHQAGTIFRNLLETRSRFVRIYRFGGPENTFAFTLLPLLLHEHWKMIALNIFNVLIDARRITVTSVSGFHIQSEDFKSALSKRCCFSLLNHSIFTISMHRFVSFNMRLTSSDLDIIRSFAVVGQNPFDVLPWNCVDDCGAYSFNLQRFI
ncbi:unnamed protein product, partial [Ixodes pacificus]